MPVTSPEIKIKAVKNMGAKVTMAGDNVSEAINDAVKMSKKNKMKTIFFETVVSEIDNIKSYFAGKRPYEGHGDPNNIFKNITPEFIHKNYLGSRILAIYKND